MMVAGCREVVDTVDDNVLKSAVLVFKFNKLSDFNFVYALLLEPEPALIKAST